MVNKEWQVPKFKKVEFHPRKSKYCVCIPVINEGEKIRKQLKKMSHLAKDIDIIICDGGSTDGSLERDSLNRMGVNTLLVKKDSGKLSAQLRMGYSFALERGYKGIVTVDGNNKDSVDDVPDFMRELDNGYDMIQGSRFIAGGKAINTPKDRLIAIKLIHAPVISLIAGFHFTDTTNGFRAYSSRYLLDEKVKPFRDVFDTYELLAYLSVRAHRLGYKTKEIPVTRSYPKSGKAPTKISFFKGNLILLRTLLNLMVGNYNPKS